MYPVISRWGAGRKAHPLTPAPHRGHSCWFISTSEKWAHAEGISSHKHFEPFAYPYQGMQTDNTVRGLGKVTTQKNNWSVFRKWETRQYKVHSVKLQGVICRSSAPIYCHYSRSLTSAVEPRGSKSKTIKGKEHNAMTDCWTVIALKSWDQAALKKD